MFVNEIKSREGRQKEQRGNPSNGTLLFGHVITVSNIKYSSVRILEASNVPHGESTYTVTRNNRFSQYNFICGFRITVYLDSMVEGGCSYTVSFSSQTLLSAIYSFFFKRGTILE